MMAAAVEGRAVIKLPFMGRRNPRPAGAKTARRLFHSVAVVADPLEPCAIAQRLSGRRFLADEAPALPAPDCTRAAACRCRYAHFEDRRTAPRREADIGLPLRSFDPEKRRGDGRRITDGLRL
jgi:hypothetical protein